MQFVHSGYAAEWGRADAFGNGVSQRIWSHQTTFPSAFVSVTGKAVRSYSIASALWNTTGTEPARVGVLAHEIMHQFGLPDLYDPDVEGWGVGSGLGSYCLMSNSWGFDNTQRFPPLMSPYAKILMGWVQPTLINTPGTYTSASASASPTVYKVSRGYPEGEYLLIENRQPVSYDGIMPQGGIAIYHIDEKTERFDVQSAPESARTKVKAPQALNMWPWNHYRASLVQADGLFHMEVTRSRGDAGDLYRLGGVSVLGPNTVPDTNTYQNGVVRATGLTISVLSPSAPRMQFQVSWAGTAAPSSPAAPAPMPSEASSQTVPATSSIPQPSPCAILPTTTTTPAPQPTTTAKPTITSANKPTTTTTTSAAKTTTTTTTSAAKTTTTARPAATATAAPAATMVPAPSRLRLTSTPAVTQPKASAKNVRGQAVVRVSSFGATMSRTTPTVVKVATRGAAAVGVRVNGRFERVNAAGAVVYREYVQGVTDKTGLVKLQSAGTWAAGQPTKVQFCIVSVSKAGFVQDLPAAAIRCVGAA